MIGVPRIYRSLFLTFVIIMSIVVCGFANDQQSDPSLSAAYVSEISGAARESLTEDPQVSNKENHCDDPRLAAAETLAKAKMFGEAEAVVERLLSDRETAMCAAKTAANIEEQKRLVASDPWSFLAGADAALSWISWTLGMVSPLAIPALIGMSLWRFASFLNRRSDKAHWRLSRVTDNSSLGVAETWRSALTEFRREPEASLGLLSREFVPVPQVLIIGGSDPELLEIFKNIPDIRGVPTSWVTSLLMWISRQCRSPRRTIEVDVKAGDKSVTLRVSIVTAENKRRSVAKAAAWDTDGDSLAEIEKLANRMAITTSYMLAGPAGDAQADAKIRLHDGFERLNAFVKKNESHALEEAAQAFAETRRLDPEDMYAALHEGIARELMEDHGRAGNLFQLVIERTEPGSPIQSRAQYNLAISHLRRYTPEGIERAEEILEQLIRDPNLRPSDLRHFARAGLANVITHRFIFWNIFPPDGPADFDSWSEKQKPKKRNQLKNWSERIDSLVHDAKEALSSPERFQGDCSARTQLEWLIQNACGNRALNLGKYASKPGGINDPSERKKLLEEALDAFRQCEALVPAGVETLTNIATTLLALERPTEAMKYTKQARTLNAKYEYAYYREAQALIARDETDKCVELLNEANTALGMIAIPGFQGIFESRGVNCHVQ